MDKSFIDSLNVGDLVAVRTYSYGAIAYNLLKVEEITTRAGKRTVTIGPITDEVRTSIKRRREQAAIAAVSDWSTLSDDKIARIAAILKE